MSGGTDIDKGLTEEECAFCASSVEGVYDVFPMRLIRYDVSIQSDHRVAYS